MTGLFFYEDGEGDDRCLKLTLVRDENGEWRVEEIEHITPPVEESVAAD